MYLSKNASGSEKDAEGLKILMSRAQELAKSLSSNVSVDQATRGLVKESVDKLALAHNKVLDSEKSKLRSMQFSEHKT